MKKIYALFFAVIAAFSLVTPAKASTERTEAEQAAIDAYYEAENEYDFIKIEYQAAAKKTTEMKNALDSNAARILIPVAIDNNDNTVLTSIDTKEAFENAKAAYEKVRAIFIEVRTKRDELKANLPEYFDPNANHANEHEWVVIYPELSDNP